MQQKYLEEALMQYNMQDAKAELIRHNENMTFQVADEYLLRIHKHVDGFSTHPLYDTLNRIEIYKNELALISHLKTQGMAVQSSIPNIKEEYVTLLSDGTPATMLKWIPGHTPDKSELQPKLCYQIGEMVGKLHKLSCSFQPTHMLTYDAALCERLKRKLVLLQDNRVLNNEYAEILADACTTIATTLRNCKENFIPIHADLAPSNMLITDAGLVPIDFSLWGYGHPMMDISSLYCQINGIENRRAIAAGYQAFGGTIDLPALDCCFALNVLLGTVLHCNTWTKEDWFSDRLKRWCTESFIPLNESNPLFSPDFYLLNAK